MYRMKMVGIGVREEEVVPTMHEVKKVLRRWGARNLNVIFAVTDGGTEVFETESVDGNSIFVYRKVREQPQKELTLGFGKRPLPSFSSTPKEEQEYSF